MSAFGAIVRRDVRVAMRRLSEAANPLLFFVIVTTLFPLALSPNADELREVGVGVLWVSTLLSSLLALEGLFRGDADDGSLEQLMLSPVPISVTVLAKIAAHWLMTILPLIALVPDFGAVVLDAARVAADHARSFGARDADAECADRARRGVDRKLAARRNDRRLARLAVDGAAFDLRHAGHGFWAAR